MNLQLNLFTTNQEKMLDYCISENTRFLKGSGKLCFKPKQYPSADPIDRKQGLCLLLTAKDLRGKRVWAQNLSKCPRTGWSPTPG